MDKDELKWQTAGAVAELIRKGRESMGWTIYRLAEKSGIPAGNLCRIESGLVCPRIDTMQRICIALKLEIQLPLAIQGTF